MRRMTCVAAGERRLGALRERDVVDLNRVDPTLPTDRVAFLEGGPAALERARGAVAGSLSGSAAVRRLSAVKRLAPMARPPKIICVGRNSRDHVAETAAVGRPPMEKPSVCIKVSSAVIGPGEPIVHPPTTGQLDDERAGHGHRPTRNSRVQRTGVEHRGGIHDPHGLVGLVRRQWQARVPAPTETHEEAADVR